MPDRHIKPQHVLMTRRKPDDDRRLGDVQLTHLVGKLVERMTLSPVIMHTCAPEI